MLAQRQPTAERLGEKIGFFWAYALFTTILSLVLYVLYGVGLFQAYLSAAGIAVAIVGLGLVIRRLLR